MITTRRTAPVETGDTSMCEGEGANPPRAHLQLQYGNSCSTFQRFPSLVYNRPRGIAALATLPFFYSCIAQEEGYNSKWIVSGDGTQVQAVLGHF